MILEDGVGLTEDDISRQRGLGYARDLDQARALLRTGKLRLRVPCYCPRPLEQFQAVAAAGETMPPKSTYFLPEGRSPGLLFNPLSLASRSRLG